jgi:hypothetical protein
MPVPAMATPSGAIFFVGGVAMVLMGYLWKSSERKPNPMFGWAMTEFLYRFLLGDIVLEASIMFRMLEAGAVVFVVGVLDPTSFSKALGALSSYLVVTFE